VISESPGRVAIVTGAGQGLGRAYAEALARRGIAVLVEDAGVGPDGRGGEVALAESVAEAIRR
jgi:NAD(P)-dependent dehydrogenase (short-subunit alcohol dehydrogenase family)